jgi:hypothetical protein
VLFDLLAFHEGALLLLQAGYSTPTLFSLFLSLSFPILSSSSSSFLPSGFVSFLSYFKFSYVEILYVSHLLLWLATIEGRL